MFEQSILLIIRNNFLAVLKKYLVPVKIPITLVYIVPLQIHQVRGCNTVNQTYCLQIYIFMTNDNNDQ